MLAPMAGRDSLVVMPTGGGKSLCYQAPALLSGNLTGQVVPLLVTSQNPDLALPLCYISAALIGVLGLTAVGYNLRISMTRRPTAA